MPRSLAPAAVAIVVAAAAVLWPSRARSHETLTTTVLFDREIVRILNSHCVMCHSEGGPSFPLETYEQAWLQGRKMRSAVIARHMPPWAAFQGYGQFANDNAMTLRESQFVVSWVEGLGPRNAGTVFTNTAGGNAAKPAVVRAHADFGMWHLGQPDLVRALEPIAIEPRQTGGPERAALQDDVKRVVVDLGLAAERNVRAFEYMPGDRRVVQDAVFTVKETGQWIGSWTPWYGFVELPRSTAYRIPAGAHVIAEIHYHQADVAVVDRGKIGLFFDPQPGATVSDLVVDATGTRRLHGEVTLAADTTLLALRPDVTPGIASVEVSARKPDGGTDVLLFAKDFSLDWRTPYIFARPVMLRRGTTVAVTAYGAGRSLKTTISTVVSGSFPRTSTRPDRRSR